MDISKPYEKMLLIDEEEYLKLKNLQYGQEHYDDSTQDDGGGGGGRMDDDDDGGGGGGHQRFSADSPGSPPSLTPQQQTPEHGPKTPTSPAGSDASYEYYDEQGDLVHHFARPLNTAPDFQYATAADLANNTENLREDIAKAAKDLPIAHKLNEEQVRKTNEMLDIINETFGEQAKALDKSMFQLQELFPNHYERFLRERYDNAKDRLDELRGKKKKEATETLNQFAQLQKQRVASKARLERSQIVLGVRTHEVDLDASDTDDAITLLNKTMPAPMLVSMNIEDQAQLIDQLASLSKDEITDIAYEAQDILTQAYNEANIESFGAEMEVETEPLRDVHANLERVQVPTKKVVKFAGKQPKSLQALQEANKPSTSRIKTPDVIHVPQYFTKGKRLRQKNAIYAHLNSWGIFEDNEVRDYHHPGMWHPMNISKVIDKLMSNSHRTEFKKQEPEGFKQVMQHIRHADNLHIFALLGDYIRRKVKARNPDLVLPPKKIFKD